MGPAGGAVRGQAGQTATLGPAGRWTAAGGAVSPLPGGQYSPLRWKTERRRAFPCRPWRWGRPHQREGKEGLSVVRPHPVGRPAFRQMGECARRRDRKIERRCAISVACGDGTSPPDRGQERVSRPPTPPGSRPALRQVKERAHRGRKLSDSAPSGRGGSGPCQLEGRGQRQEGQRPSSHKKGAGADLLGVRPRPLEKRRRENEKSGKVI